jgi:RNA polymerase sigma-70 factor (ECF subfamily)
MRSEEAALDAAQETFTRAWERWPKVAEAKSPIGWLMVTVTRICIDRIRYRNAGQAHARQYPVPGSPAPEAEHLARLVVLRLAEEKPLCQQVVVHAWLDGMTQEEVAALLGVSRKTVQRQLEAFRARHGQELAALAEVSHD